MTKVLVTGATGFLGGAICADLRAAGGWDVTATGRNPEKGKQVTAERFVPADLAAPGAADALARGHEAVVHCAALASPWGRREEFERANVAATAALLDACV
ncbi:MAG: NAD(P)-dependent oxidoreductase, partial [Gluconacetobacter diazotrophicus]|nr:NAD(P)-dependent oxidoreductase [Gluconacetobacter diazotrophicus]